MPDPQQQQQQHSSVQQQQAANGATWLEGFDADTKSWVSGKGWDKLDASSVLPELVKGYRGAERTLGVPADQILRLPGKDAKPEDWRPVWQKLGAPDKPEGYEIKAPEGDPGEFLKTATGWFHELGIPKPMAQGLAAKWNEFAQTQAEAAGAAWDSRFDKEMGELKTEWGQDFDKNRDLARRVEKATGLQVEQLQGVERALGPKAYQQFLARFGAALGEHRFVGGEGEKTFSMSADAAKARIAELGKDEAFKKKLMGGDVDAKAEWTKLHEAAFGTELANAPVAA
jgi:hypothetical protein